MLVELRVITIFSALLAFLQGKPHLRKAATDKHFIGFSFFQIPFAA